MRAGSRRHILMVLENNPYPQDGRVRREARALIDAGYRVTVIAPKAPEQPWSERVDGVSVLRFRLPPERDGLMGYVAEYGVAVLWSFLLSLFVFVRHGFAAMHVHNPPDLLFLVGAWYRPLGVRFVFDHHDLSPEMYRARFGAGARRSLYRALRFFERLTFRLSDHVIASNESYAQIARTRGGVPAESITVVRNGPDPGRVRLLPADPDVTSRADFVFGYVGEMAPQDGVDYLIRSLGLLASELGRPDFYCFLIGGGSEVQRLEALAGEVGIADKVSFTGHVSDSDRLMTYLSSVDICMAPDPSNPYTDRSTLVKVAEYMALGRPIVAFDLPETRRTAADAAIYAEPNDAMDFARKIGVLMDEPGLRARMGDEGRRRVEAELSWPHQARQLIAAYDALLGVHDARVGA